MSIAIRLGIGLTALVGLSAQQANAETWFSGGVNGCAITTNGDHSVDIFTSHNGTSIKFSDKWWKFSRTHYENITLRSGDIWILDRWGVGAGNWIRIGIRSPTDAAKLLRANSPIIIYHGSKEISQFEVPDAMIHLPDWEACVKKLQESPKPHDPFSP